MPYMQTNEKRLRSLIKGKQQRSSSGGGNRKSRGNDPPSVQPSSTRVSGGGQLLPPESANRRSNPGSEGPYNSNVQFLDPGNVPATLPLLVKKPSSLSYKTDRPRTSESTTGRSPRNTKSFSDTRNFPPRNSDRDVRRGLLPSLSTVSVSRTENAKAMEKFCDTNIVIPPELPNILKAYAKGAMRTQPPDLLRWSGAYFRALANGTTLPVKDRLEEPGIASSDGLTPGLLRVLNNLVGNKSGLRIHKTVVMEKWRGLGLPKAALERIINEAEMNRSDEMEWDKLIAVFARTIGKNLGDTMNILCQVLTVQPEGQEPQIKYQTWWAMYTYLANLKGNISSEKIQVVGDFLLPISYQNSGAIGPRDFINNSNCPSLE